MYETRACAFEPRSPACAQPTEAAQRLMPRITAKFVWIYVFCYQNELLFLLLESFHANNKTGANYLEIEHECVIYSYTCTNDIVPI